MRDIGADLLRTISAEVDEAAPGPFPTAWAALDRLAAGFGADEAGLDPQEALIETTREALGTDRVFVFQAPIGSKSPATGLPANDWFQAFAWGLIARLPVHVDRLCRGSLQGPSDAPRSVAMVRLSRSRSIWLVAMSLQGERPLGPVDLEVMVLARRMVESFCRSSHERSRLNDTLVELVKGITSAVDARDTYEIGHSERVGRLSARLGRRLGLEVGEVGDLYLAGLLHDVGKMGVVDSVLRKAGALTPAEYELAKQHVVLGDAILSGVSQLRTLGPGVRNHHERYDGNGYPDRLGGRDIPMLARVVAVAESYDAMVSHRHYRPPLSTAQVMRAFSQGAGLLWDPDVVTCLLDCRPELVCAGPAEPNGLTVGAIAAE